MLIDAKPIPGYREPYGLLCSILQDGTHEWRLELDPGLSEDAVVWQPYPRAHSIGAIIFHIAMVEVYWFERFALDLPWNPEEVSTLMGEAIDVDAGNWPQPPRQPISWYFELHDRIRARTLETIKEWPAGDVTKANGDRQISMRWVLGHVIQHEAYHGGQAVLLNSLWHQRESAEQV